MQANFLLLIRDSAIAGGLTLPFTQCQTPDNIVISVGMIFVQKPTLYLMAHLLGMRVVWFVYFIALTLIKSERLVAVYVERPR